MTIDADIYLKGLEDRLLADGGTVTHEPLGLVGYKAETRALVRAHLLVVAAKAGPVDQNLLADFAAESVDLAVERKGRWRGFQSAVVVLPILVAESAGDDAVAITQRPARLDVDGFAVLAQPAVVDLSAGRSHIFQSVRIWGYAFNSLIKRKLALYLPDPV
ncbi:hypothetical protein [Actinoplanes solisilvae]|uniref:hypothetical protein n=1 Tax=Actinoplanes solisilvae TaxID=2486853 RepID=UPI001F0C34D3|nr:hypothetical protein [Actinoplanes solisilvae]